MHPWDYVPHSSSHCSPSLTPTATHILPQPYPDPTAHLSESLYLPKPFRFWEPSARHSMVRHGMQRSVHSVEVPRYLQLVDDLPPEKEEQEILIMDLQNQVHEKMQQVCHILRSGSASTPT